LPSVEGPKRAGRPFYGCENGKKTSWFGDLFIFIDGVFTAVNGMQRSKLVCERGTILSLEGIRQATFGCQKWYTTGKLVGPRGGTE